MFGSEEEDDGVSFITTDAATDEIFFNTETTDGILDTGCSKDCGGDCWFKKFFSAMSEEDRREVSFRVSEASFKFGDGRAVKAIKKVVFPAYFGEQKMFLTAHIVKADIPLLISLPTMKKMKLSIHCHKDEGSREGGARARLYTRSNHHWVRILKNDTKKDHIGWEEAEDPEMVKLVEMIKAVKTEAEAPSPVLMVNSVPNEKLAGKTGMYEEESEALCTEKECRIYMATIEELNDTVTLDSESDSSIEVVDEIQGARAAPALQPVLALSLIHI